MIVVSGKKRPLFLSFCRYCIVYSLLVKTLKMNAYEMGQLSRQGYRNSDAYLKRISIQFRKKKEPHRQKPHHIQALDGKVLIT